VDVSMKGLGVDQPIAQLGVAGHATPSRAI